MKRAGLATLAVAGRNRARTSVQGAGANVVSGVGSATFVARKTTTTSGAASPMPMRTLRAARSAPARRCRAPAVSSAVRRRTARTTAAPRVAMYAV
ncbi:hypothetical protein STANM309S_05606 [Streptomyces tanashiensis]